MPDDSEIAALKQPLGCTSVAPGVSSLKQVTDSMSSSTASGICSNISGANYMHAHECMQGLQYLFLVLLVTEFPHEDLHEALELQLNHNFKRILKQYSDYVSYIRESIIQKAVTIDTLKTYLLYLPALHGEREKLKQTENISDVFLLLYQECTSFLNYEIFQEITTRFGIYGDCDHLKYPEYLKAFVKKHTIAELISIFPTLENKWDPSKRAVTLKIDIEKFQRFAKVYDLKIYIAKILGLNVMCVELVDVKDGCVLVTFLVPAHIVDSTKFFAKGFTAQQVEAFRAMKIIWLKCGDKYLLDFSEKVFSGKLALHVAIPCMRPKVQTPKVQFHYYYLQWCRNKGTKGARGPLNFWDLKCLCMRCIRQ